MVRDLSRQAQPSNRRTRLFSKALGSGRVGVVDAQETLAPCEARKPGSKRRADGASGCAPWGTARSEGEWTLRRTLLRTRRVMRRAALHVKRPVHLKRPKGLGCGKLAVGDAPWHDVARSPLESGRRHAEASTRVATVQLRIPAMRSAGRLPGCGRYYRRGRMSTPKLRAAVSDRRSAAGGAWARGEIDDGVSDRRYVSNKGWREASSLGASIKNSAGLAPHAYRA